MKTKVYAKNFLFVVLLCLSTQFKLTSQNWHSLGSNTPVEPVINVLIDNADSLVVEINIRGFYEQDINENGVTYKRISLFNGNVLGLCGAPELPHISDLIAFEGKQLPSMSINILKSVSIGQVIPYPVPNIISVTNPNGATYAKEEFYIDDTYYSNNSPLYPNNNYTINYVGKFREQKFVSATFNPFIWNPNTQTLTIAQKTLVKILYNEPISEKSIYSEDRYYSKICSDLFINNSRFKNENNKFRENSTSKGNYYARYYKINSISDFANVTADYIVIADNKFVDVDNNTMNAELHRLIRHRLENNNYTIGILSAQNIMSNQLGLPYVRFPQFGDDSVYIRERRIRHAIKSIYDMGSAPNTIDGRLAHVLLVGDAVRDIYYTSTIPDTTVPASYEPYDIYVDECLPDSGFHYRGQNPFPTDNTYANITEGIIIGGHTFFDPISDVNIGRIPAKNEQDIHNYVEKLITYELNFDIYNWRNRVFYFCDTIESNKYFSTQYGFYNYFLPHYINYPHTIITKNLHPDYTPLNLLQHSDTIMKHLNFGNKFTVYTGHGNCEMLCVGEGNKTLTSQYLMDSLKNVNKSGFAFFESCSTGRFDNRTSNNTLSEDMIFFSPERGFSGVYAASDVVLLAAQHINQTSLSGLVPQRHPWHMAMQLFSLSNSLIGNSIMYTKNILQKKAGSSSVRNNFKFNLLSEPCLNINATSNTIIKDIELNENTVISELVIVKGANITVPNGGTISFEKNGRLYIDDSSTITFIGNAKIFDPHKFFSLYIKGDFISNTATRASTIEFIGGGLDYNNAKGDFHIKNIKASNGFFLKVNNAKSFVINSDSTQSSSFNRSVLEIYNCDTINVSNTGFNSSYFVCQNDSSNIYNYIKVEGCEFVSSNPQSINQDGPFFTISGINSLNICNNRFYSKDRDAIFLKNSGLSTSSSSILERNELVFEGSNNSLHPYNGVRIYNSKSTIKNNYIYNFNYGISVLNCNFNDIVIEGNGRANSQNETQNIKNNFTNQIFVDEPASFPKISFNHISNSTNNNPLIFCGGNVPSGGLNVKCNDWNSINPQPLLLPLNAYIYNPIWDYSPGCNPNKTTSPHNDYVVRNSEFNKNIYSLFEIYSKSDTNNCIIYKTIGEINILNEIYKNNNINYNSTDKISDDYLHLYPIPCNDKLYISLKDNNNNCGFSYNIVNSAGITLKSGYNNKYEQPFIVNVSNLKKGIYVIKIMPDVNKTPIIKTFIKH